MFCSVLLVVCHRPVTVSQPCRQANARVASVVCMVTRVYFICWLFICLFVCLFVCVCVCVAVNYCGLAMFGLCVVVVIGWYVRISGG